MHEQQTKKEALVALSTGKIIDLFHVTPEDIHISDIGVGLAKLCRFNGQCNRFYSVAQHSVEVACVVPDGFELEALLHDAAEAYIGDLISPIKALCADYTYLEERIKHVIAQKFGIPSVLSDVVKEADKLLLAGEMYDLFPPGKFLHWFDVYKQPTYGSLSPNESLTMFMDAFRSFMRKERP